MIAYAPFQNTNEWSFQKKKEETKCNENGKTTW